MRIIIETDIENKSATTTVDSTDIKTAVVQTQAINVGMAPAHLGSSTQIDSSGSTEMPVTNHPNAQSAGSAPNL